ncbi:MAG: hypothetical protein GX074_04905 [Erysipelothrix sp.]|nr:hypothetical protein [Erysipelothrix sp.]
MKIRLENKLIRKMIVALFSVAMLFANVSKVDAASFTASASTSSVAPGGTFTISLGGGPVGVFDISVSNGTSSTSFAFFDAGVFDPGVKITAGKSGTVSVTITARGGGDVANMQGEVVTGSKTVNVKINTPEAPKPTEPNKPTTPNKPTVPNKPVVPTEPEVVKSKDNTLKSITISEGSLSPEFKSDVYEYSVLLPKGSTSLDVSAVVNDSVAKVANTGNHKLEVGENLISLIVTPEEGSEGLYKINVYVEEEPKHKVEIAGGNFDVIEHYIGADVPDSFSEVEVDYKDGKLNLLYSELWETHLAYMNDEENNREFYIVDIVDGELKVVSKFQKIAIYGDEFLALDVPEADQNKLNMTYGDVVIGDQTFKGFKYNDPKYENFSVIYVRNMAGEDVYYQYETGDDSYQLFTDTLAISEADYQELVKSNDTKMLYMQVGLGALGLLSVGLTVYIATLFNKNKKLKDHFKNRQSNIE